MPNRMKLPLLIVLTFAFTLCAGARTLPTRAQNPAQGAASDRAQDGLTGPVRRVKTETAKITTKNGKPVEGPRVLLESATYDIKGAKVDNAYFLAAAGGTLTGKEVYKYDDKGNIVEMTLQGADGSLLSKEVYTYEFDALGNWTKMVTSVAVVEGGKMIFEPTEVTYRTISYFLDEATLAKMSQPAPASAVPASANTITANNNAVNTTGSVAAPAQPVAAEKSNTASASQPKPSAPSTAATEKAGAQPSNNASAVKTAVAPPPAASADKVNVSAPAAPTVVSANNQTAGPVVVSEGDAPERPVARGSLKPISGGILNGKAVNLPAPIYPDIARRAQVRGIVTVEVIIDLNGRVISAKAVDGPALLQGAAEQAARMARFSPTLLSGQPVRVSGQITYKFMM